MKFFHNVDIISYYNSLQFENSFFYYVDENGRRQIRYNVPLFRKFVNIQSML